MDEFVDPVDQVLLVGLEEINQTELPEQRVRFPSKLIVGTGFGFTVMFMVTAVAHWPAVGVNV